MAEIDPGYGPAAAGRRIINQRDMDINSVTAVGAHLTLSDDGLQITGSFAEPTTGISVPITLFR